jgi:hypothetical protein
MEKIKGEQASRLERVGGLTGRNSRKAAPTRQILPSEWNSASIR